MPIRIRVILALSVVLQGCCSPGRCSPPGGFSTCCTTSCDGSASTAACTAEADLLMPMRDGVRLATHIVLPAHTEVRVPTLLLRTPYGSLQSRVLPVFRPFTTRGYAFVYQQVRGTGGSEGALRPITQEFADGHDAVRWITRQPWSNGRVGTLGGSYDGLTALAAALDTPEVKVAIVDGLAARGFESFPATHRGALSWDLLWWDHYVKTGEDVSSDLAKLTIASNHRPARDLDVALFGAQDPIWREAVEQMEKRTSYWDDWDLIGKFGRIHTPVLYLMAATEGVAGPLDCFLDARQATRLDDVRQAQRFVLGSHAHTGAVMAPFGDCRSSRLVLQYIDKYLGGRSVDLSSVPTVQYFVQNAGSWGSAVDWPATSSSIVFYLHPAGAASANPRLLESAPATESFEQYGFDPAVDDPCQGLLESLVYQSSPLTDPMDIVGAPTLELHASADAPDADVFAYLAEVPASGKPNLITVTSLRLRFRNSMADPEPLVPDQPFQATLTFLPIGYRVSAGSTLRLTLTSAECGVSENPNTGGSIIDETSTRRVQLRFLSGPGTPSRLVIPVLE